MKRLEAFLLWALTSLMAISLVGDHPYAGLITAFLGGITVGWAATRFPNDRPIPLTPEIALSKEPGHNSPRPLATRGLATMRRLATWTVRGEIAVLLILYGIYVVLDRVPWPGLVALALLWLARWWVTGRLIVPTALNLPVLFLLAVLPVTLWVSADKELSLPKVYGLILSAAMFFAVAHRLQTWQQVWRGALVLALAAAGTAMLGLAGTSWIEGKLFSVPWLYGRLPHLVRGIPRLSAGGFHPNGIAGTLAFFTPLLAGLSWSQGAIRGAWQAEGHPWWQKLGRWWPGLGLGALGLTVFTLLLTQSRGGFIGVAAGLTILAGWHKRRILWVILTAGLLVGLGVAAGLLVGRGTDAGLGLTLVETMDVGPGGLSLAGRQEAWQRAIYMIQDFPFTGIGIGTFDRVADVLYPFFLIGPDANIPHAHNNLLEVGVDTGIPGLVAYVALLVAFGVAAWRAYLTLTDAAPRALIAGLVCGMLAHQVFGITDAFILGTKPGVVMWVFLGFVAGLDANRAGLRATTSACPTPAG